MIVTRLPTRAASLVKLCANLPCNTIRLLHPPALLDRLLHHARVFTLDGESYRIKISRNEV